MTNAKPEVIVKNPSPEANLRSAKRSLRQHRHAYMHRRLDLGGDVIDIIDNGQIIERHIADGLTIQTAKMVRRVIPVEEMALYQ